MKVLFVCSGNSEYRISPIIQNQVNSLIKAGVEVDIFPITGKGAKGYILYINKLRQYLRGNKYDIIHAHYSLSGIVSSLSGAKPIIVSLMGSDVYARWYSGILIWIFAKFSWNLVIVKSAELQKKSFLLNTCVIPNGVDLEVFKPAPKEQSIKKVNFPNGVNIIFVSDPGRKEKNYLLAEKAVNVLNLPNIHLHTLYNLPNKDLVAYYNAADLILLTSKWEGSPNVIKEAMSCNCPIVSTDVGDVKRIISEVDGCYLCTDNPDNISRQIRRCIEFQGRTSGRNRIIHLGLDSENIANKIIEKYNNLIN